MAIKVVKILLVMTLVVARWKMVETWLESLKVYMQLVHNDDIHDIVIKKQEIMCVHVYHIAILHCTCSYMCIQLTLYTLTNNWCNTGNRSGSHGDRCSPFEDQSGHSGSGDH